MKLIGRIYEFNPAKPSVEVPFYHRVALGLESNTAAFLTPVPRPEGSSSAFNEILITTVHPSQWPALWRLSLTLKEGPQGVAEVLDRLKKSGINISTLETLTTERDSLHSLLAIVDVAEFGSALDGSAPKVVDLLKATSDPISKRFVEIVEPLVRNGLLIPPCSIARLERLFAAHERRRTANMDVVMEATTDGGHVKPVYADEFQTYFEKHVSRVPGEPWPTRFLQFSDTEEKHISVHFVRENEVLLRASIAHGDKIGAILDFARGFGDANILSSYSRLRKSGHSAQWKVTLEVTSEASCRELLEAARQQSSSGANAFFNFDAIQVSVGAAASPRTSEERIDAGYAVRFERTKHFVGRDAQLSTLVSKCTDRTATVCLVNAYSGSGKSLMLKKLNERLMEEKASLPVLLTRGDFSRLRSVGYAGVRLTRPPEKKSGEDSEKETEVVDESYAQEYAWLLIIIRIHEVLYFVETGKSPKDDFVKFFVNRDFSGPAASDLKGEEGYSGSFLLALSSTIERVRSRLGRRVVLLIDRAEHLLDPKPKNEDKIDGMDREGFVSQFKAVLESAIDASWVFASATHCLRHSSVLGIGAYEPVCLYKLDSVTAAELVIDPFQAVKIMVPRIVVDEILHLSGCQPMFIQALCVSIQDVLNAMPKNVDVVTPAMVQKAIALAIGRLHPTFIQLKQDIQDFAHEEVIERLGKGELAEMMWPVTSFLSRAVLDSREVDLHAIPGIEVFPAKDKDSCEHVGFTPLFGVWLDSLFK